MISFFSDAAPPCFPPPPLVWRRNKGRLRIRKASPRQTGVNFPPGTEAAPRNAYSPASRRHLSHPLDPSSPHKWCRKKALLIFKLQSSFFRDGSRQTCLELLIIKKKGYFFSLLLPKRPLGLHRKQMWIHSWLGPYLCLQLFAWFIFSGMPLTRGRPAGRGTFSGRGICSSLQFVDAHKLLIA